MQRETNTLGSGQVEHFRSLDSLGELLDTAKRVDGSEVTDFRYSCASLSGGFEFTHTNTLGEAIELCEYGWAEGRERVIEKIGNVAIDDAIANLGNTIEYSFQVSGDEPDIDRYLADDPENMIDPFIDPTKAGRNVKLIVNSGQHAFMEADRIERRGVTVAVALDLLSTAGYGVELDMAERTSNYGGATVEYRIPIVESGSYVNVDTLSFCLIHPSFLRRLIFALNESEPEQLRQEMGFQSGSGYGRPEYLVLQEDENSVIVDKDDYLLESDEQIPEKAAELVQRLIDTASQQAIQ